MITRLITTGVLLFFAVSLHAQDAQVIQLSDADAHAAAAAYNALTLAQDRWNAIKAGVQTKYVTPLEADISQYVYPAENGAWSNGFAFSVGFKFIVPAQSKPARPCFGHGLYLDNGPVTVPATVNAPTVIPYFETQPIAQ